MMYSLMMVVALAGTQPVGYKHDTLYNSPEACVQAAKDIGLVIAQVVDNVSYIGYQCRQFGEQV